MELTIIFSIVAVAVIICLVARRRSLIEIASITGSVLIFFIAVAVAMRVASAGIYAPNLFFAVDALGALTMLIIAAVGVAVTIYSVAYLRAETKKQIIGFRRVKQYFILLNLFVGAMLLAATTAHPIFTWISIEATTLSTAFLISFYNKPTAMEAAWKYLIINSVGLLLGFFGTLLYFTALAKTGSASFTTWTVLLGSAGNLDPFIAKIAFVFVLIGYGTKIGLAPLHTWLPDAHSKAPTPVSALLSGVLLNVAFVTMLRFKAITDIAAGHAFSSTLLITFGLLSLLVAALIIFTQKNYKRLLAYSSVENMGIAALGFGFGGVGIVAALFHLVFHSLIKSALFLTAGNIFLKYSSTKIANVRGALKALPVSSVLFFLGFFAVVGTPPFGTFLTKLLVINAGIAAHPFVAVTALIAVAVLFIGFFRRVTAMVFGDMPDTVTPGEGSVWLILPPLALLTIAFYLSFQIPAFLSTLITSAASHY